MGDGIRHGLEHRSHVVLGTIYSTRGLKGRGRHVLDDEAAGFHDLPIQRSGQVCSVELIRRLARAGADLVTFSGDKLLGGVQAGVVVGRDDLIRKLNANPMKRALRLDKTALVLLDETLKAYEDDEPADKIPLLGMIALPLDELERRGRAVVGCLAGVVDAQIEIEPSQSQLGSGALPGEVIESRAVTIAFDSNKRLQAFEKSLRRLELPVVARIADGKVRLDMRGAAPLDELLATLKGLDA